MRFTIRQLRYAVAVARHGSITAAAQHIGISQPAISAALKGLEEEFELSIFLRQPSHRIVLTPVGQRFIRYVHRLIEHVDDFNAESRGLGHEVSGSIEVGCFFPIAPFIMPIILRAMKQRYPEIDVHIHEANLGELNNGIKSGSIEVALMYDMQPDKMIKFETLVEAKPYVLLSADDPLAVKKSIRLRELHAKEMILFDLPITQNYFTNIMTMVDGSEIGYRTKSYEMLRSLVASGMGFSILIMRPYTDRSYDGSKLVCLSIEDSIPLARFGLAMAKSYAPTRINQYFVDLCRTTLRENAAAADYFL